MKTKLLILFFILFAATCFAQAPNWIWAKSAYGRSSSSNSVAIDKFGNIYVAGYFRGDSISFDAFTLINNDTSGNTFDLFLAKYDNSGNIIWAKKAGGTNSVTEISVAVDTFGNIYAAGNYTGSSISFDSIILIHTIGTGNDIFLAKYDTDGNVIWAKSADGLYDEQALSVTVDISGNAYVTGIFNSYTLSFNPNVSLSHISSYCGCNPANMFLVKFDPNGNALWAKSAGCKNFAFSVAVDKSKNVFVTGFFSRYMTLDNFTIVETDSANSKRDIFLVKLDSAGNVLWLKKAGGTNDEDGNSIAVDILGNVYLTGAYLSPTIDFGTVTLTNTSNIGSAFNLFLAKYDPDGNTLWAKSATSMNNYVSGNAVAVDDVGNPYVAGYFGGCDLNFGSYMLAYINNSNILTAKYDINGNFLWAKGTGCNGVTSIALDPSNKIYIAGNFCQNVNFDAIVLPNLDFSCYMFLAKLNDDTLAVSIDNNNRPSISIFPNPASNSIKISVPQKSAPMAIGIEILNIEGQIIRTINSDGSDVIIDVSNLSSGVYIIKVQTDKGISIQKLIKQ